MMKLNQNTPLVRNIMFMILLGIPPLFFMATPLQVFATFILPFWSIGCISLWHDIGRSIWEKYKETEVTDKGSLIFIGWMALVFTFVIWTHVELFAIPLLFLLPLFVFVIGGDILIWNWDSLPRLNTGAMMLTGLWVLVSYPSYWVLNFLWLWFFTFLG